MCYHLNIQGTRVSPIRNSERVCDMDRQNLDDATEQITDFDMVYNRNEGRVKAILKHIIEKEGLAFTNKDMQDAFAITMNRIPAHYVHKGTIVLHANVTKGAISDVVRESLMQVLYQKKP